LGESWASILGLWGRGEHVDFRLLLQRLRGTLEPREDLK